jgi:hypothetical protein
MSSDSFRVEAKRAALEGIVSKPEPAPQAPQQPTEEKKAHGVSL